MRTAEETDVAVGKVDLFFSPVRLTVACKTILFYRWKFAVLFTEHELTLFRYKRGRVFTNEYGTR